MKRINFIIGVTALILAITACNDQQEEPKTSSEITEANFSEIEPLLGVFTEKRQATEQEIADFDNGVSITKSSCSLDSDAECSRESTAEFLRYANNCITYPVPPFGGFYTTTTLAAISYYVDGDGDVNCDNYEDDIQNMINNIINTTGPVWNIQAEVYQVSPCNERSRSNYIVFELTILTPNP
ncbi:hypothetical protein [Tenacibaculum sp. M341]|uniref:hypothetical protein n=1 Tax=Tenacibaculum sp. M341 TaxID=2530339 RepID=UPI0010443510|nr:hypothetical protein [Tenacibaculum sp. M341]TCI94262.1 hypothetical protein EYW44_02645 [Tenacibaculum sp. M341]